MATELEYNDLLRYKTDKDRRYRSGLTEKPEVANIEMVQLSVTDARTGFMFIVSLYLGSY